MKHIDKVFEECLYRFKGKSCAECPLNCLNKDKNGLYQQIQQLKTENDKLRNGLKEITVYTTNHCTDKRALYLEQIVSDCNKAEQKLEKIKEISKGCCDNCDYMGKNDTDCECTNSKLNTILEIIEEQ